MLSTWATTWCILVVHVYLSSVSASNTSCPTWFYYNNTTHQCECESQIEEQVHCNQLERKAQIANGFCVTSTEQEGLYYAGSCPLSLTENNTNRIYSELPSDPDLLNEVMCGPYNRKGLLCGECIDGYGPAVFSPYKKCENCSKISTGFAVSLYLLLELTPITLLFVCVVVFRLSITAGPLLWYVLFCQIYIFTLQTNSYIYEYILSHVSPFLQILFYSSLILSNSWILQLFTFVIPPFCISERLTSVHIELLSLVPAVYPILLVIITCILMELHARNYRIIHTIWKPFGTFLSKLKVTTVTSDAVIQAFATFILLSASTLSYNVSTILMKSPVYRSTDGKVHETVVYSDPTIVWFSQKHVLYILTAAVPYISLVLIPFLLLCVYPTRIYRYLSQSLSARKRLAITAFAEALNNCFKDGLNGTRDYRALIGIVLFVEIMGIIIMDAILPYISEVSPDVCISCLFIFLTFLFSYLRPCKLTIANLSLSYHSMVTGLLSIALHLWRHDMSTGTEPLEWTTIILPVISHILMLIWAGYMFFKWIMSHCGYQFNTCNCKAALSDLANAAKQYFHRRRGGYQILANAAAQ